ncbi:redoxin domain-containing protein [Clostridium sediminicola]|uniref:TlpA family protein disulfide reductase n=1 Tax=Clostridium sediminicola TaxID=3114879 RepID=UPI0031F22A79
MNKKKSSLLPILIILLTLVTFTTSCSSSGNNTIQNSKKTNNSTEEVKVQIDSSVELKVGEEAPNFTLENLSGKATSLKDYRGKIVLINFWATWCKYCDKEMPDLEKFNNENDDLIVLAVDVKESKNTVEKYIKKGGYTFPVLLDKDAKLASTYLVSAYPTSYFVDEEGILLGSIQGMMTYEKMNEVLTVIRNNQ